MAVPGGGEWTLRIEQTKKAPIKRDVCLVHTLLPREQQWGW